MDLKSVKINKVTTERPPQIRPVTNILLDTENEEETRNKQRQNKTTQVQGRP